MSGPCPKKSPTEIRGRRGKRPLMPGLAVSRRSPIGKALMTLRISH
jgi:hypothetical protein